MNQRERRTKLVKGSLSATFAFFMALCFHILGGGSLPTSPFAVLLPLSLAVLICTVGNSPRRHLGRLTVTVGVSQMFFHTVFSAFEQGANLALTAHGSGHEDHHSLPALTVLPEHAPSAHAHGLEIFSFLDPDHQMLASHALATLLTVAIFYRYETLLEHLRNLPVLVFTGLLHLLTCLPAPRPVGLYAVCSAPETLKPPRLSLTSRALRGPPVFSFTSA